MQTRRRAIFFSSVSSALFLLCIFFCGGHIIFASANPWLAQGDTTIRQIFFRASDKSANTSKMPDTQFTNCEQQDFYVAGTHASASDCLTRTAFGYMTQHAAILPRNSQTATGIRSGIPFVFGLSPVPEQSMVLALTTSSSSSGSYIHFYKNILTGAGLKTDPGGQLYYEATRFPDTTPTSPDGSALQMIDAPAFSRNGAWMTFDSPGKGYMRLNLATQSTLLFGPSYAAQNGVKPQAPSSEISDDGRYAVIAGGGSSSLQVYDLSNCGADRCQSYDFTSDIDGVIPNVATIVGVHFVNDVSIEFTVLFKDSIAGNYHLGTYRLFAPGQSVQGIDYLALGDSFASGQGAYDYKPGTDTSDNICHVSNISYPFLLAAGRFKNYNSVACSAATMNDVTNTSNNYAGQTIHPIKRQNRTDIETIFNSFKPGYIDQLDFVQRYNPSAVTLSVGGNDIGFSAMMSECTIWASTCYEHYEDRLAKLKEITSKFNDFVSTYDKILKNTLDGHVYVVGYPHIIKTDGDCALNVHLNAAEALFSEQLIDYLNSVIRSAAQKAGVQYVDATHALDGHRLCETSGKQIAVNGLTAGSDKIGAIGNESYHPNALGHQLLEKTILAATKNMTMPMPQPDVSIQNPAIDYSLPILQDAQKTGAVSPDIYTNDPGLINGTLVRGEITQLSANSLDTGMKSDTAYSITLHSDPIDLGTFTSDSEGNLQTQVIIPDTATPGYHTIHITGLNQSNEIMDIYQSIYVAANQADYDGDGVINDQDSCPYTPNSGVDHDGDGIDDACDNDTALIASNPVGSMNEDSKASVAGRFAVLVQKEQTTEGVRGDKIQNSAVIAQIAAFNEVHMPHKKATKLRFNQKPISKTRWWLIAAITIVTIVTAIVLSKIAKQLPP